MFLLVFSLYAQEVSHPDNGHPLATAQNWFNLALVIVVPIAVGGILGGILGGIYRRAKSRNPK